MTGAAARAMLRLAGALAAVVIVATPGVSAQEVVAALTQTIAKLGDVPDVKGKKVGVGDFPLSGGKMSELGSYVADQLDVALTGRATAGGFEVVTRRQLCQVIRENKLWVDDQFDPSLHKKLGRLSQADLVLTGQVTPLGNQASVSLRLLDTETGRVAWADSLTLRLDDGLRALLARVIASDGCGAAAAPPPVTTASSAPGVDRLQITVSTDKPSYRIGDTVQFRLKVNRDAYVTLVNIGTSGDVTILYPNRFHASHLVRSGQDVTIPPADSGFVLTVQGPTGFDQVRAIATAEPVQLHASDFGGPGATTFRSLDRVQTRSLAVLIKAERDRVATEKWAEHVVAVEVKR